MLTAFPNGLLVVLRLLVSAQGVEVPANSSAVRAGVWSWACGYAGYQGNQPRNYYKRECLDQVLNGNPPSWLRGWFMLIYWRDLEPEPGVFDWTEFDANLTKAVDAGLQVQPIVYIWDCGTNMPDWMANVSRKVMIRRRGKGELCPAPDYFSPAFQARWRRVIEALAAHLVSLPRRVRQGLWAVQAVAGITGDNRPWDGAPVNPSDAINASGWMAYSRSIAALYVVAQRITLVMRVMTRVHVCVLVLPNRYVDTFVQTGIPVIANLEGGFSEQNDQGWFLQYAASKGMKGASLKEGVVTHWYNVNGEVSLFKSDSPLLLTPQPGVGGYARARGELAVEPDPTQGTYGNWAHSPWWSLQANAEWCLTFGIDVWNLYAGFLGNDTFATTMEFFNRHAGHRSAESAPAAFISFRDSLDTADVRRFPMSEYGPVNSTTDPDSYVDKSRVMKILAENADRGASLGDQPSGALSKSGVDQKKAMSLYDVCWMCFPGNYGRFLKQVRPFETSIGWWQLGPRDQPWGRFARGLQHKTNRTSIQIELDSGLPVQHGQTVIKIVYFDRGTSRWALAYNNSPIAEVRKKDTERWQVFETNASLKTVGGTFSLSSPDQDDCIFSFFEVITQNM